MPERVIVIEFPTVEDVNLCFGSQEYQKISTLRENPTKSKAIIVEAYTRENTTDNYK